MTIKPIFFFDCDNCLYVSYHYAATVGNFAIKRLKLYYLIEQRLEREWVNEAKVSHCKAINSVAPFANHYQTIAEFVNTLSNLLVFPKTKVEKHNFIIYATFQLKLSYLFR